MSWPTSILSDYRIGSDPEENFRKLTDAVRDLQRILQGGSSIGTLEDPQLPNSDSVVVEMEVASQGVHVEVNNPLGREPVGVISLASPGVVRPRFTHLYADVNHTSGSTTITSTGSNFLASMAGGFFTDGNETIKIKAFVGTANLTLYDPMSSTASTVNGLIMHKWEPDTFWLYLGGMKGYPGYYRFLVF